MARLDNLKLASYKFRKRPCLSIQQRAVRDDAHQHWASTLTCTQVPEHQNTHSYTYTHPHNPHIHIPTLLYSAQASVHKHPLSTQTFLCSRGLRSTELTLLILCQVLSFGYPSVCGDNPVLPDTASPSPLTLQPVPRGPQSPDETGLLASCECLCCPL